MAEWAMVNAVLIGFGVIAIAIGAVLYIVQFRQGLRADASKKWPRASGTVIASAVEKSPGHRWRYRAALQYSYRVGGKNYQSNRYSGAAMRAVRSTWRPWLKPTRPAAMCGSFTIPKNPAEAVLDPIQNTGSRQVVLYAWR